jgi:hypothetical protein
VRIEEGAHGVEEGVVRGRLREVRLESRGEAALALLLSRERREGDGGYATPSRAFEGPEPSNEGIAVLAVHRDVAKDTSGRKVSTATRPASVDAQVSTSAPSRASSSAMVSRTSSSSTTRIRTPPSGEPSGA